MDRLFIENLHYKQYEIHQWNIIQSNSHKQYSRQSQFIIANIRRLTPSLSPNSLPLAPPQTHPPPAPFPTKYKPISISLPQTDNLSLFLLIGVLIWKIFMYRTRVLFSNITYLVSYNFNWDCIFFLNKYCSK
jgi:hypothetical protein